MAAGTLSGLYLYLLFLCFSPLLIRTLTIGFRDHSVNPGRPRLESLHLIISSKTLVPGVRSRCTFGGATVQPNVVTFSLFCTAILIFKVLRAWFDMQTFIKENCHCLFWPLLLLLHFVITTKNAKMIMMHRGQGH